MLRGKGIKDNEERKKEHQPCKWNNITTMNECYCGGVSLLQNLVRKMAKVLTE